MAHGVGDVVEVKEHEEDNMAAWLIGIKTIKIQPYHLPPLGKCTFKCIIHV